MRHPAQNTGATRAGNQPEGANTSPSSPALHLTEIARHPEKWGSAEIAAYTEAQKRGDMAQRYKEQLGHFADVYNGGNLTTEDVRVRRWQILAVFSLAGLFFLAFATANRGLW